MHQKHELFLRFNFMQHELLRKGPDECPDVSKEIKRIREEEKVKAGMSSHQFLIFVTSCDLLILDWIFMTSLEVKRIPKSYSNENIFFPGLDFTSPSICPMIFDKKLTTMVPYIISSSPWHEWSFLLLSRNPVCCYNFLNGNGVTKELKREKDVILGKLPFFINLSHERIIIWKE